MQNTTIQITVKTKNLLDSAKKYRRETYNDVINRLLEETGYVKKETRKESAAAKNAGHEKTNAEALQDLEY